MAKKSNVKKVMYKNISLQPTDSNLYIYKSVNIEQLVKAVKKDFDFEIEIDNLAGCVYNLERIINKKGEWAIIMILLDDSPHIIAHEAVHVVHNLQSNHGIETGYGATEWFSLMLEYIVKQTMLKDGYKAI